MARPARNLSLETALSEARERYAARRPASRARHEAAARVMPGGNTRSVLHYSPFPFTVVRGRGARITDADGFEYADFLGEYTAGLYGHDNPVIGAAIEAALREGVVLGGPNRVEAELAGLICERFPAVERLRFTNSGTEANIMALAAARAFTGREAVMVAQGAYHGGVLSFEGDSPLNLPFPIHRIAYNDSDAAGTAIRDLGGRLAAVVVEPMIGAGGGIPGRREFLETLRTATRETGALLIFDEVMTSRHTRGGLHGHHRIAPDLVTLGKYLGGGLSFGAFGGRADIMDRFDPARPDAWSHPGTFNNNILTMSAGHAGLSRVFTPEVADAFFARGNRFRATLAADLAAIDAPVSVTGLGSMAMLHLAPEPPSAPRPPGPAAKAVLELLHLDMIERGQFYARRGQITLSLATTEAEADAFRAALAEVVESRAPLIRAAVGI